MIHHEDPQANVRCVICGHKKELHMVVCGDRDCECLCFVPEKEEQDFDFSSLPPLEPLEAPWQETAIMAVFDLIMLGEAGEVTVKTKDGRECRCQVGFLSERQWAQPGFSPLPVSRGASKVGKA